MRKQEFLDGLRDRLVGLPKKDLEERLVFYGEMIDDRVEEGLSEEQAVLDIGSVEEISAQIIADIPLARIAKEKIKPKRRWSAWEIVLLVLGSPIWLSLLVAAFAVVLSLYAALWSVVISLWAVFASLVACAFGGVAAGVVLAVYGNAPTGAAVIGTAIICAGLAIFLFFGCKAATKGTAKLAKKIIFGIKKCFMGKERAV